MITLYNKYSVFYIINKLFVDGLLKLWFFKLGIKGLRSTIEFGADGKRIKPLVKLYTKRKAKKLMSNFKIITILI